MKKLLILLVIVLVSLSMTSCTSASGRRMAEAKNKELTARSKMRRCEMRGVIRILMVDTAYRAGDTIWVGEDNPMKVRVVE